MKIKAAIIDLYKNEYNEGIRCIKEIISSENIPWDIYDARYKNEIPDTGYDIYISSGGPGNPFDGEGAEWEKKYFDLLDNIIDNNLKEDRKKHLFFICHSFQIMARYFKFAEVNKRYERSFGVHPFLKTIAGEFDPILKDLPGTFYAADFRQYQVIHPNNKVLKGLGASIISMEPPDNSHEPAVMGVRISNEIVGTQFHPEADPASMTYHFQQKERKESVVNKFGESKYTEMLELLERPDGIKLTRATVLPSFLKNAVNDLTQ
jgi:homoserine O-succinyltransferase/O-acetyltransferase